MHRYVIQATLLSVLVFVSCQAQPPGGGDSKGTAATSAAGHSHDHAHAAPAIDAAVCVLVPMGDSGVSGVVRFKRAGDKIAVTGDVKGLTPGKHGFHVHEFGDVTDTAKGESAGGHFNPEGHQHGRPDDEERHAGDFGNIEADANGEAKIDFEDAVIRFDGPTSIIGRSLVVHVGEDKFVQPTGDAGARVAVGVIGVAKP